MTATGKRYYWQDGGRRRGRYWLNVHDGAATHADGSPFFALTIFSNRKKLDARIRELIRNGYTGSAPFPMPHANNGGHDRRRKQRL